MSKNCEICGRGTGSGFTRSHSNIQTKKTVKINLQSKKIDGKATKVCTKCIKGMAKVKKTK